VAIGMGISMLVFLLVVARKADFLRNKVESLDAAIVIPPGSA
jgi:hypothetical protein